MPEDENAKPKRIPVREPREIVRYSGPIPPAEELARYEATLPGAADRLIAMAEREQVATLAFRNRALLVASAFSALTVLSIAYIMSLNATGAAVVALALVPLLPSLIEFAQGLSANRLDRQERETDIQIRQDLHQLDMQFKREEHELRMAAAKRRLESPTDETDDNYEEDLLEEYGDADDAQEGRTQR